MAVLDWIFLAVLLVSMLLGGWRGFVFEAISLAGWVAAFLLARWWAPELARHLPMTGASELLRYAAAFLLTFVVVVLMGALVGVLARKLLSSVGLRPADRILGALFGLTRGVMVLLLGSALLLLSPLKESDWWRESMGAHIAVALLNGIKTALPGEWAAYLRA